MASRRRHGPWHARPRFPRQRGTLEEEHELESEPLPRPLRPRPQVPAMGPGKPRRAPQFPGAVQSVVGLLRRSTRGAQRLILLARSEQRVPLASPAGLVIPLATRSPRTHPPAEPAAPRPHASAQSMPAAAREVESKASEAREVLAQRKAEQQLPAPPAEP
jgi:hypothetical protein